EVAAECDVEIGQAAVALRRLRRRGGDVLLAYPYGSASDFITEHWLPEHADRYGITAAFGAADGIPASRGVSRGKIPRYVCGANWKSTSELGAILRDAGITPAPREAARASVRAGAGSSSLGVADWRACLHTWEVDDARVLAGSLFRRCFGHEIPE